MPYRVLPDGSIVVDSLEEAFSISDHLRRRSAQTGTGSAVPRPTSPIGTHAGWSTFLGLVRHKQPQKKLMALLKAKGSKALTLEELRTALSAESNNVVGGIASGIVKNAKKAKLAPEAVIARDAEGRMKAGPLLLQNEIG